MVKKINLTDSSSASNILVQESAPVASEADISSLIELMGKMDWKLWEMYKTMKRFEKLYEADQVTFIPPSKK